jgi:hypothetical protein
MLAITGFHGLTTTGLAAVHRRHPLSQRRRTRSGFSLGMAVLGLTDCRVRGPSRHFHAAAERPFTIAYPTTSFAMPCPLPIALFTISHNMEHLLMEGPKVVAMASTRWAGDGISSASHWVIPADLLGQAFFVRFSVSSAMFTALIAQKTSIRLLALLELRFGVKFPCDGNDRL